MSNEKIVKEIIRECKRLGEKAYEIAKETVLKKNFEYKLMNEAVYYFMELWHDYQHPALLAIACEAVGGKPEKTTRVGASLVLLAGAADLHDDIIDNSKLKGSKVTVLGKFGTDMALLLGDALLFEGLKLLETACEDFPKEKGRKIKDTIEKGFAELAIAEAMESSLKRNWSTNPEDYFKILQKKAAVSAATAKAGAIIGDATPLQVMDWWEIGRSLGVLASVRDEFIDIYEVEELRNRRDNECLPLPVFYAFLEPDSKVKILNILKKDLLNEDDAFEIAKTVLETKSVQKFKAQMQNLANKTCQKLRKYRSPNIDILLRMTKVALEGL